MHTLLEQKYINKVYKLLQMYSGDQDLRSFLCPGFEYFRGCHLNGLQFICIMNSPVKLFTSLLLLDKVCEVNKTLYQKEIPPKA